MTILPDANILIAYFDNIEPIASLVEQFILRRKIIFSVVCVAEFLIKASPEQTRLVHDITGELGIAFIDRVILDQAVEYRKQSLRKSKKAYLLDCFIAATTKVHRATLVTLDRADYPFSNLTVKQPDELFKSNISR